MKTKHTPGPWRACGNPPPNFGCTLEGDPHYYQTIAGQNHSVVIRGDVSVSDARLIAAAPDLLKELRMLLLVTKCPCASTEDFSHELYWSRRCHRCAMAKDAIAKAEGRHE